VIGCALSEDEALVEIGVSLAAIGPGLPRREALAHALARFVDDERASHAAIASLLERAGADAERARTVLAQRGTGFTIR
jgi:hypothetical protein